MKKFALSMGVLAALGITPPNQKAPRTPKKPWQTRVDYKKKPTICKNPKIGNQMNQMYNKYYGEKFGYEKTDFV